MDIKLKEAFAKQINLEWESAYLYLSLSFDMENADLSGFSNWMRTQASEEMFHARKMFDYLVVRGETPELFDVKVTKMHVKSPIEAFEVTLEHEQDVSVSINKLSTLAQEAGDHASYQFLQWFVNEQVEEEDSVNDILGQLRWIKDDPSAIFSLNRELADRVFTEPTITE